MSTAASASHPASTPCTDNTDFMSTFNSTFKYWKTNSTVLKARNGDHRAGGRAVALFHGQQSESQPTTVERCLFSSIKERPPFGKAMTG